MELRPSDIRFSQDSINNYFDKRSSHSYKSIGQTLDDLCEGTCRVSDIPTITVVKEGGHWITADNRRLWVFRQLERLGKCDTIAVCTGYSIPDAKRTSNNGGASISVRRNPGGSWHLKPSVRVLSADRSARHDPPSPRHDMESIVSRLRRLHTSPGGIPYGEGTQSLFHTSTEARRTVVTPALATQRPNSANATPRPNTANVIPRPNTANVTPRPNTANVIPTVSRVSRDIRRPTTAVERLRALSLVSRSDKISEVGPIGTRVARYTYGIKVNTNFVPGIHPEERKSVVNGKLKCCGHFSTHIKKGQQIEVGQSYGEKGYYTCSIRPVFRISIYRSDEPDPMFVDEASCRYRGQIAFRLSGVQTHGKKGFVVKMVYDGTELWIKVRDGGTRKVFKKIIH